MRLALSSDFFRVLGSSLFLGFPDSVVFASDYPHGDGTFPGSTTELLETTELPRSDVQRILCDNARRLYGLDD